MTSRFTAHRVRPANRNIPRAEDGTLPVEWLIAEWPEHATEPTDYWLSTLPEDTPLPELVRVAKIRWRIEPDYRELKQGLGLAHFEGRTFAGWHHHATLVTAAHLFVTTLRLTAEPKVRGQPELLPDPAIPPDRGHPDPRPLPLLPTTSRTNLTKYH